MPDTVNHRHITVLVDRSGSMQTCREDTQGGLAAFITEQAKEFPDTTVTLHQFDDTMDVVYSNRPITDVPPYTLAPRGGTALLDAIGNTINATKEAMKAYAKDERPDVIMVILTDGHENRSTTYDLGKIKAMTEKRQAKGWTFIYLGANQDAITVASSMGMRGASAMTYNPKNTSAVFATASGLVTRGSKGMGYEFTDDDRTSAVQ